jgi:aspartyl-tRNA(Asn)/glutamyl-tRNA(Gln) amidotransferase subunit C
MITREDVKHIADLARLKLTEGELEEYTRQLSAIIGYMDELNAIDTSGVEPTCFVVPGHDPQRDDVVQPSLDQDEAMKNGPMVKNGFFAVPKVIDQ